MPQSTMVAEFWNQRELFRAWVGEAKAKLGATNNAVVAEYLGIASGSLYKYLSNSATHKPSADVLKKLGDLIGRDYRLLLDTPAAKPDWLDGGWSEIPERDRVIAQAMFADITADDLTEEEKDELYAAWKEAVARARRYKGMNK
jgi:transcriptional regulator with XRE-family HTH domain